MALRDGTYARGFQQTYGLISGAASHFSDGMALIPEEPVVYRRNGVNIEQLPEDFYSTKNYTDELLSWMEKDNESGKPFFAYLTYTAPHDPLHAPRGYIDKYRGKYNEGFEALRESRFEGLKAQGIINADAQLPEWPLIVKGWHKLTTEEQANRSRDMEVYAAMVDVMDEEIGRIYQWLENSGKLENTVIVFLSDNGANAYKWSAYPSEHPEYFDEFDNSFENRGASKSFVSMEAEWAAASNAGLRLFNRIA